VTERWSNRANPIASWTVDFPAPFWPMIAFTPSVNFTQLSESS
jgi:hypothetical protein